VVGFNTLYRTPQGDMSHCIGDAEEENAD